MDSYQMQHFQRLGSLTLKSLEKNAEIGYEMTELQPIKQMAVLLLLLNRLLAQLDTNCRYFSKISSELMTLNTIPKEFQRIHKKKPEKLPFSYPNGIVIILINTDLVILVIIES